MGYRVVDLYLVMSGAIMLGAWASGVFFLKFWKRTRDRLFLMFGIAFWILALERVALLAYGGGSYEDRSLVYVLRLFAFLLIIASIVDKNLKERRG